MSMYLSGPMPGGLSSDAYCDRRLRPLDAEHYSAAGILPYRRSQGSVELLLPKERPWNSFTQAYDPLGWNLFGGKRVPRQERSVETTAVRCFLESVDQVDGAPGHEALYGMMQGSFVVWYPMGKFALLVIEVPEDIMADLPERFATSKKQAGPSKDFRILPMGIKKYVKQIDELVWVPASSLVPEAKEELSDLLSNVLQVETFRDFLTGDLDPAKAFPDAGPVEIDRTPLGDSAGKGKGKKGGKAKGKGKLDWRSFKGGKGMMYPGMKGAFPMPPIPFPPAFHSPYAAAASTAEIQRQMYGEQLYMLVQPMSPNPYLAQKITGMLLELPQNELMMNLTNQEELRRRVGEALEVLREDGVVG